MAACRGLEGAGNYAVASIVHSSVASDDGGSFQHQAASAVVACVAMAEADSEFYAIGFEALLGRFSVGAAEIETPTRCPENVDIN